MVNILIPTMSCGDGQSVLQLVRMVKYRQRLRGNEDTSVRFTETDLLPSGVLEL